MIAGLKYQVLVPAQQEPLTLQEAKDHLRVVIDEENNYIQNFLIPAARNRAENYLRRVLCEQTLRVSFDSAATCYCGQVTLPVGPVRSIELIAYHDDQNDEQVLATDQYSYDLLNEPVRIYPAFQQFWPSTSGLPGSFTIDFIAGYPPGNSGSPTDFAANIPAQIKQAMLLDIGHLYENRESVNIGNITSEIPLGWDSLLWPYRLMT